MIEIAEALRQVAIAIQMVAIVIVIHGCMT